jgi:hypothetical protein
MFFLSLSSSCRRAQVLDGFEASILRRPHQLEEGRVFGWILDAAFGPCSAEKKTLWL